MKPHQCKGWLNSKAKIKNHEEFDRQVKEVCEVYKNAQELKQQNIHVICTDEKTGIQTKEHIHPLLPMKPGQVERYEQEYKRHGTSGLIASRDVVTGEIITPLIQPTRTEADFVKHIREVVSQDPKAQYVFVMDQLNTHKSESLVRFVAEKHGIEQATLGEKGKTGILKSMESRSKFLADKQHKIRIVYTPKHSSWLNQIEIWFSILTRRLLNKRSSFKSIQNLEQRIIEFIEYYNKHLAKAFKWTYAGKLLQA